MKSGFAILLIVAVLFGGGYWYFQANAVCDVPIAYRIDPVDPRFEIEFDEARSAVSAAESTWEDATGQNLFTYDENASFSINFLYDGRQAFTDAEDQFREELDERRDMSDEIREQYEDLLDDYEDLKDRYERQSSVFEEKLQAYNAEVEKWNEKGGAPEQTYNELGDKKRDLADEQKELNSFAYELNQIVTSMNRLARDGNVAASDYNEVASEYNERFTEEREFTQGDYRGDHINIYQFESIEELTIVLAHEFGHALSIDHVEGVESYMYHKMGEQSLEDGLTIFDVEAYEEVCGDGSGMTWPLVNMIKNII